MMQLAWGYIAGAATCVALLWWAAERVRREGEPRLPALPFTDRARRLDVALDSGLDHACARLAVPGYAWAIAPLTRGAPMSAGQATEHARRAAAALQAHRHFHRG